MAVYRKVRQLSISEAAYLAGLIDGEGTITLARKSKNEQRSLVVSVANTELALLEYPKEIIGAGHISSKRGFPEKHTPSFAYKITSRQALELLKQITPFLKSYKKQRAELVLSDYVKLTPRNGRYNQKIFSARQQFVSKFFEIKTSKHSPEELCL